jgi:hypothetical protein
MTDHCNALHLCLDQTGHKIEAVTVRLEVHVIWPVVRPAPLLRYRTKQSVVARDAHDADREMGLDGSECDCLVSVTEYVNKG